jgi:hypothetical protein
MTDWRESEVRNETRARDLNELIEDADESTGSKTTAFVCECSDAECITAIHMTRPQYEDVRAHPTRFAIALDHESPELDLIVAEHTGFAVIRKLPGLPARLAIASDPRRTRIATS